MGKFLWLIVYFCMVSVAWSGPFWVTDTAIPVGPGVYKLEESFTDVTSLATSIEYEAIPNMSLKLTLPYFTGSHSGFGDLEVKSKIRFVKGREADPLSVAGQIVIKIPTAGDDPALKTSGEPDVGFVAIASKPFNRVITHGNLGYIFIGGPGRDQLKYSLGFDVKTQWKMLNFIGELYGQRTSGYGSIGGILGGATYRLSPDLVLSGLLGLGLTHSSPDSTAKVLVSYSLK